MIGGGGGNIQPIASATQSQSVVTVSNEPKPGVDIQKFGQDLERAWSEIHSLSAKSDSALAQANYALEGVRRMEPTLYLGFFISVILLITLLFVAWPVFQNYFFNSYLYQSQAKDGLNSEQNNSVQSIKLDSLIKEVGYTNYLLAHPAGK